MTRSGARIRAVKYDAMARRQSTRAGRQRGCYIYIPSEELRNAGVDVDGPPPFYRTRGYQRSASGRSVIVELYTER
jgi:hypothetical protein